MINVMIADDEEVIRRGLEKITSRMEIDVHVIGSYGNGLEALGTFRKVIPGGYRSAYYRYQNA